MLGARIHRTASAPPALQRTYKWTTGGRDGVGMASGVVEQLLVASGPGLVVHVALWNDEHVKCHKLYKKSYVYRAVVVGLPVPASVVAVAVVAVAVAIVPTVHVHVPVCTVCAVAMLSVVRAVAVGNAMAPRPHAVLRSAASIGALAVGARVCMVV